MGEIVSKETVLKSITLVNWGAWDGSNTFEFNTERDEGCLGTTVLTGLSGSGKSTVLDGFTHLMLRRGTRFNEAADQVKNHPKEDRRTICTYMMGRLLDEVDKGTGQVAGRYLRPNDKTPIWSAVACTFLDLSTMATVSAAVLDWLPVGRRADTDVTSLFVIRDGATIDPLEMQRRGACAKRFDRGTVQSVWPDSIVFDRGSTFRAALYARVGVTDEAMRVLNRIQASSSFSSIDELFKSLVLRASETYSLASVAVSEFDDVDESHRTYLTYERRINALDGIDEKVAAYDRRLIEQEELEALTGGEGGPSPFEQWKAAVATRSYTEDLIRLSAEKEETRRAIADARATYERSDARYMDLRIAIEQKGGNRLGELDNEIRVQESELQRRRSQRERLGPTFRLAGIDPTTKESWERTLKAAEEWLSSSVGTIRAGEEECDVAAAAKARAAEAMAEAETRLDLARTRGSGVTPAMASARGRMASAAGLDAAEVPFVAELVDVAEGEEGWRKALDDALGNISRVILVPKRYASRWRRTVDPIAGELGGRYSFEFVDIEEGEWDPTPNEGCISSVAQVDQSSPFADYVGWRIANNKPFDYRLADSLDGLSEEGRIVQSGQTSSRDGGAVGHRSSRPIIGFRSDMLVSDAEAGLANARAVLDECEKRLRDAKKSLASTRDRAAAVESSRQIVYGMVDVASCGKALESLRSEREAILHAPSLRELARQRDQAAKDRDDASRELANREGRQQRLERRQRAESREVDRWNGVMTRCVRAGVTVSERQGEMLDGKLETILGTLGNDYLSGFDSSYERSNISDVFRKVNGQLAEERSSISRLIGVQAEALVGIFKNYVAVGEDPDCPEPTVERREEFVRRYHELLRERTDLARRESTVRDSGLVAARLAELNARIRDERRALDANIDAINTQIGKWDFGDYHGSIHLAVLDHRTAEIRDFQGEMASLASMATRITDDGDAYEVSSLDEDFERLRGVCERLRGILNHSQGCQAELIDPFRSVEIVAWVDRPDLGITQQVSSDASMSGGEKQEIFAFLTTAAVLFALDMAGAPHPSYTAYIMDEAFIASDGNVTARALDLLRGVGFQLVCVAPEGKTASYEEVRPKWISVVNDKSTHKSTQQTWRPKDA